MMTRSILLLGLLFAGAIAPAKAQNPPIPLPPFLTPRGTPEDQRACRPDAVRLCREYMDNDDMVLRCFQARRQMLNPACAAVLTKYGR